MRKRWLGLLVGAAALVAVFALLRARANRQAPATPVASTSARPKLPPVRNVEPAELIYDGRLAGEWQDLGWGPHDLGSGAARIRFGGFGGIILQHAALRWAFGGVTFRYRAPQAWGTFLSVELRPEPGAAPLPVVTLDPAHLVAQPDGWQEVFVSAEELNPTRQAVVALVISAKRTVSSDWVSLDKVALTKPPLGAAPSLPAARQQAVSVRCDGKSLPIDLRIYGAANDDWTSGQTALRLGGNTYSRMNFELGTWNTGSDWFFENVGAAPMFQQLEGHANERHRVALVVPIIGFVAKDAQAVGFPRSKFAAQRKFDEQRREAGDGYSPAGTPLKPGPPEQTSTPAPPELIGAWVRKLREAQLARGTRTVELYILDNEPSLWNETHRDVRPAPLGYDELLDRTLRYATAVKEADPEAVVAGPAEWGWTGYFYSAVDREAGIAQRPDRRAHGDLPLIAWYLRGLAEREKATGKRLLDVLDVHFYPMAPGVRGGEEKVDAAGSALRLRSTRALWDPGYKDESWIKDTVELIPRLKRWVADYYPGTKIAIGEWSFGGAEHISGGLATAEALGRFGSLGVDAAYHWGGVRQGTPTYWAFRAFRNFDGEGGRFLDSSLATDETADVSLFASADESRKHLVLILLNKNPDAQIEASVNLTSCGSVLSSRMFSYAAGSRALERQEAQPRPEEQGRKGFVSAPLGPYSMTVLDVRLAPER